MKRINISMDSLNPEKYAYITGGGDLRKVLAGIEEVHRIGFSPIKINIVAMKGFNDDEILDFANLTVHKPYQIRFIELMNMGSVALDHHNQYLSNMAIKEEIGRIYPLEPANNKKHKSDGPAEIYRIVDGAGEIGFISPLSHKFCHACNRLRLTADGRLRICLLSDEEVDLKGPLRDGCTDADLIDLIKKAITQKPLQHDISCDETHRKKCMTDMSSIGG
jgi:cyclic pyranopterin phosphate synthase